LRTFGLRRQTRAHASLTDTFAISNVSALPRNRASANQSVRAALVRTRFYSRCCQIWITAEWEDANQSS